MQPEQPAPQTPREIFAEQLRLLFEDAGKPTLAAVAAEAERAGVTGVTVKRLSAWRRGDDCPAHWEPLRIVLLVLIGRARKLNPRPVVPERYHYPWWQALWKQAQQSSAAGKAQVTRTLRVAETPCPYRGLASFGADDAQDFFGRDAAIAALLKRLGAALFAGGITALVGASGAGKSSLVRAGLIPALKNDALPGARIWPVLVITPGERPLATLVRHVPELVDALHPTEPEGETRTEDLDRQQTASGETPDSGVEDRVGAAARAFAYRTAGPAARLLLILDQAEELFTLCEDAAEREQFIATLAAIAAAPAPGTDAPALVLACIRADFIAPCLDYPELAEALQDRQMLLGPMTATELGDAISRPAMRVGYNVEPALVEQLRRDIGGRVGRTGRGRGRGADPGILPLLSHALLATWEHRKAGKLTLAGYHAGGGIEKAVARSAERAWGQLDSDGQKAALNLLLRLTRIGHDTQDTRRRCDRRQLIEQAVNRAAAEKALDVLATARLVTLDAESAQITHEALLHAWPRLSQHIDRDRDGNLIRQELEEVAAEWALDHDTGRLYRGTRLAAAHAWTRTYNGELSPTATEFIAKSTQQAHRSTTLRRAGVTALAIALIVALTAMTFAFTQRASAQAERDTAVFTQVVAQADRVRDADPSLAAQLDLTAYRMRPNPELYTDLINTENTALSTPLPGHTNIVRSVVYSPDGRTLASSDDDGNVRLWDVTNPERPAPLGTTLPGHLHSIRAVAFSPDGHLLASAGKDAMVRLWNTADPARPVPVGQPLAGGGDIRAVAFSPTGHLLASAGKDGMVRLWNTADPARPVPVGQPLIGGAEIRTVAFSSDGHLLASAGVDRAVRLWNLTDPAHPSPLGTPIPDTDLINTVSISPNGHILAAAGLNQIVRLWNIVDPAHPTPLGQPLPGHANSIFEVTFSPDGRILASASGDGTVRLWNMSNPAQPALLGPALVGHTGGVDAVTFSPDGRTLATASADRTVRLWNLPAILTGYTGRISSVAYSPDGHTLATGGAEQNVRLWNVTDPNHPVALDPPLFTQSTIVDSVAFSPDGRILAAGNTDHTVRLWNVTDPAHPTSLGAPLAGHRDTVYQVAFSPHGHTLASASADGTVRLWNLGLLLSGQPGAISSVAFNPDRASISAAAPNDSGGVGAVAFSPDGRTLACGDKDNVVRLWNVTNPAQPTLLGPVLAGHTSFVSGLDYSRDGRILASSSADHTIRLWDVHDPAHATLLGQPLRSHSNSVTSVAFSPDGRTLASGGDDHTVQLWNVTDPAHPDALGKPLSGHSDTIRWIAFSPDGRSLASASRDQTVRIWQLDVEHAIQRVCTSTAHTLTHQQWERYASGLSPYNPPCGA